MNDEKYFDVNLHSKYLGWVDGKNCSKIKAGENRVEYCDCISRSTIGITEEHNKLMWALRIYFRLDNSRQAQENSEGRNWLVKNTHNAK